MIIRIYLSCPADRFHSNNHPTIPILQMRKMNPREVPLGHEVSSDCLGIGFSRAMLRSLEVGLGEQLRDFPFLFFSSDLMDLSTAN